MTNRILRASAFVALLSAPITAAHPTDTAFDASFAAIDVPTTDYEPAAHAVDLDTFEPPVEAQPAETALGSGMASYYGRKFNGRRTASGEAFNMNDLTAAHRTLPFGSRVRVSYGGKSVIVRINDRGPYAHGREIDLSRAAAEEIGLVRRGHGRVDLALLD